MTKLVRDKIPQIIWEDIHNKRQDPNTMPKFRVEYDAQLLIEHLMVKLDEEVREFKELVAKRRSPVSTEAVDIIEVLAELVDRLDSIGWQNLIGEVEQKRDFSGGFKAGIIGLFKEKK